MCVNVKFINLTNRIQIKSYTEESDIENNIVVMVTSRWIGF